VERGGFCLGGRKKKKKTQKCQNEFKRSEPKKSSMNIGYYANGNRSKRGKKISSETYHREPNQKVSEWGEPTIQTEARVNPDQAKRGTMPKNQNRKNHKRKLPTKQGMSLCVGVCYK